MNKLKRVLVNLFYVIRFRKVNLKLGKGACILGAESSFEGYNRIGNGTCFFGTLGYGSYIGDHCRINATIGRYCSLSDRVHIVSGTHPTKGYVSIHPSFYSSRKQSGFSYVDETSFEETLRNPIDRRTSVYIGNDVWIGYDVVLLGGIQIGDGAIVAAGAVVTKDVEPYTIVGGVPAKPIRKRFDEEQIAFLKKFRWWDKDKSWIEANHEYFRNIETFMEQCKE